MNLYNQTTSEIKLLWSRILGGLLMGFISLTSITRYDTVYISMDLNDLY